MASIIDSYREVFTDRFGILKVFIFALPLYYSYQLYLTANGDFNLFFWVSGLTLFFILGFITRTTNNVINDAQSITPSLNPIKLAFAAIKALIAMTPYIAIFGWLANYACSFINIVPQTDIVIKSVIWLIASSIILASFLLFVKNENILDAFNLKIIFEKLGDIIVSILVFILQFAVINFIIMGFIGYALNILFGPGFIFDFFIALAVSFNIAITGHYLAQMQYDNITYGSISRK